MWQHIISCLCYLGIILNSIVSWNFVCKCTAIFYAAYINVYGGEDWGYTRPQGNRKTEKENLSVVVSKA